MLFRSCDEDGLPLSHRDDDTQEVVAKRLQVYEEEIGPLGAHYEGLGVLRRLDASGEPDAVHERAMGLVRGESSG